MIVEPLPSSIPGPTGSTGRFKPVFKTLIFTLLILKPYKPKFQKSKPCLLHQEFKSKFCFGPLFEARSMAAMEAIHQQEELWKQVFHVWTTEGAFKEGGVLYGKTVYLFTSTESQLLRFGDEWKLIHIPAVIAVVSPFPPSDKIGIASIQMGYEEILDMKDMNMDWTYIINPSKEDESISLNIVYPPLEPNPVSCLSHLSPQGFVLLLYFHLFVHFSILP
uniref:Uncharacterized protein n=1 Tax=Lactuca sativa TaxID=4236 RepID=A0A9R1UXW8_LACSA|nr:hypothetical protein LSAT_V11C700348320 [Lactuca sativa]